MFFYLTEERYFSPKLRMGIFFSQTPFFDLSLFIGD